MIRTNVVKLTTIPAFAYREKLQSGGSGIVIYRQGQTQPGIGGISKKTGEVSPSANTNTKLYPKEAFDEAMKLTYGMPYKKQGPLKIKDEAFIEEKPEEKEEEEIVVDTEEYKKLVDYYTGKDGKLSYELMNKDFIRFVRSSSIARKMIEERKSATRIRNYVVQTKVRNITGNPNLDYKQIDKMAEMLDEVYPKGVFKDLNDYIRKELAAVKNA